MALTPPLTLVMALTLTGAFSPTARAVDLTDDGQVHNVGFSGNFVDFTVPRFGQRQKHSSSFLNGGDGGKAVITEGLTCTGKGGQGAELNLEVIIGHLELPPASLPIGTTLRFIVGDKGLNQEFSGAGDGGASGGAGTAVLYQLPNTTQWEILGVAGGGGGGATGLTLFQCKFEHHGGSGRQDDDGGDGGFGYSGGTNGQGGAGDLAETPCAGGGGGALTDGTGWACLNCQVGSDKTVENGWTYVGGAAGGTTGDDKGGTVHAQTNDHAWGVWRGRGERSKRGDRPGGRRRRLLGRRGRR